MNPDLDLIHRDLLFEVWDTIALYIGLFSDYALFMLKVP